MKGYKDYKDYKELLKTIGAECKSDFVYGENKLTEFLGNQGSDEGTEPVFSFIVEFNSIEYEIGVTHEEVEEDVFDYTYWIMDIKNLEGKKWKEVKDILDKYSYTDMSNFDDKDGIVDFEGIYTDFSIIGHIVNYPEEVNIEIKDDERIYRNN